jgi:hypothetical protein
MKQIIDGKRYDTETATLVASYSNGLGSSDFRNLCEKLYITGKGNWFISGEGGALTAYAQPAGNMTTGGSAIRPLISGEALEWLERHNCSDEIEEYFAEDIEDA